MTSASTEPVDFAEVAVGDELTFTTRDNGFGGTGGSITRAGVVTACTAKSITVRITGNNPFIDPVFALDSRGRGRHKTLGLTARLRAADWYDRNVRRTKQADRVPYDAAHVHVIDEGHTMTAVWISDPVKARDPRATFDAPLSYENRDDYETIAEAKRFYKTDGAAFSGWIVRDRQGNHDTVPLRTKREARETLDWVVSAYFNR